MGMTMTQKILAKHAGLDKVEAGQLIEANLDLVLGNDITSPVAIHEMKKLKNQEVFDKDKVTILNRNSADVIRTDFIEYTQNHLLNILKHRIDREQDANINRNDADMLTRLYRYRNHEVKNEAARNHFVALMLICAHLCRYKDDEKQLREAIQAKLTEINQRSESKAATDTRAYLWIALYISTQDPVYRDAAKQYVRDYQPKSPKLRSFVSLIRKGRKV